MSDFREILERGKVFAEKYLEPIAIELDKNNRFPNELLALMAKEGFFGMHYPTQYGVVAVIP